MPRLKIILLIISGVQAATLLTGCYGLGWAISSGPDGMPNVGLYYDGGGYYGPPYAPPPPPAFSGFRPSWTPRPWYFDQPTAFGEFATPALQSLPL